MEHIHQTQVRISEDEILSAAFIMIQDMWHNERLLSSDEKNRCISYIKECLDNWDVVQHRWRG